MTKAEWTRRHDGPVQLVHRQSGAILASRVELALTRRARRTGLLGRAAIDPSMALVLAPCLAIHTAFMRFAIDVMFIDRDGRVRRLLYELPPWRAAVSPRAYAVVEMAGGALRRHSVECGDQVELVPVEP